MGNHCCQQLSDNYPITNNVVISQPLEVANQILKLRVQICSLPSVPQNVQQKIDKYAKKMPQQVTQVPQSLQKDQCRKIWKVGRPYNFIYRNEEEDSNKIPKGLCTIYKIKQNAQDFAGFFQGYIDQCGQVKQKDSVMIYSNGVSYFIGKSQTEGTYKNQTNKLSYQGGWVNEHPEGYGVQETTKGKYQGTFYNGKKSGKGKFTWNDGSLLQGQFQNGNVNGQAVFTDVTDKYRYQGQFKHGVKQGVGKWRSQKDSTFYEGQFKNGQRHGNGVLYIQGGIVYNGMFQQDQPHGIGILKDTNGKQTRGIWQKGQFKVFLDASKQKNQQ